MSHQLLTQTIMGSPLGRLIARMMSSRSSRMRGSPPDIWQTLGLRSSEMRRYSSSAIKEVCCLTPPLSQWRQSATHECVTSKETHSGKPFVRFTRPRVPILMASPFFMRSDPIFKTLRAGGFRFCVRRLYPIDLAEEGQSRVVRSR